MLLLGIEKPAVKIRELEAGDGAAIAALLEQLGYPATREQIRRRLERLALSTSDVKWVAELDGTLMGLVGIHVSASLEHDADVAKVTEIVVDERFRRQGVGGALLATAEREATRRGCELIYLTTAERRKDAHEFYRRLGYEETGRRFAKPL
jgi:GNAT superfamily N-acetyltransferase